MEIWREVVDSNGNYIVSSTGVIKNAKTGRVMKPAVDARGYERVAMFRMNRDRRYKVHRIVAEAFIPNPLGKAQVNHKDGNKRNNNVENLEWMTNEENMRHANINGLRDGHQKFCESRKRPVIATNVTTGEEMEFDSLLATTRYFNSCHVSDVIKGKRKQAKGWSFRYAYKEVMPYANIDNACSE